MTSSANKNIMVIGATGMLGSTVSEFLKTRGYNVTTNSYRWPSKNFKSEVLGFDGIIINCAGAIPQQKPNDYFINFDLPSFLAENGKKLIQPCTDCIYDGDISPGQFYAMDHPPNAIDDYGYSKRLFAEAASKINDPNVKTIRASIIGFDKNEVSLLSWFLKHSKNNTSCNGYTNHFWNGITTLQWARIAAHVIEYWDKYPSLTVAATEPISKFELLTKIAKAFNINTTIAAVEHPKTKNKCLQSNFSCSSIENQLHDLKSFTENL